MMHVVVVVERLKKRGDLRVCFVAEFRIILRHVTHFRGGDFPARRLQRFGHMIEVFHLGDEARALLAFGHFIGFERFDFLRAGFNGVGIDVTVGVGVSQGLPILVAGLLAPPGAVLLFEQPELHLHPRAQARLGDFFIGLTKTNKQCIVETHSESLVSRFRYHTVTGDVVLNESLRIYFVEQNDHGDAEFVPIEISSSGNIMNWPDGFFDENYRQEEAITHEAIRAQSR